MSTLGFGDGIGGITIGEGLTATDIFGNPITKYAGTQDVILSSTPTTSLSYSAITNKPQLFSGDFNDLVNRPVLLQGVAGQSIIGLPGASGRDGVNGKDGLSIMGATGQSGRDGLPGHDGLSIKGDKGDKGDVGSVGATGAQGSVGAPGTTGATGATGASGTPGTAGATGATGSPGPAPSGSAGQVVYLTSSGVAGASSTLQINASNITSTLPIISNITAGSSSSIPASTIVGSVATALTVSNPTQANITSVGTLTSLTATGNITSTTGVFTGNGSGLTNLVASNISGTVNIANYVSQPNQSNIKSVGFLTGLGVQGFMGVGISTPTSILHIQGVNPRLTLNNVTGTGNHLGIDVLTTAGATVPSCQLDFVDDGFTSSHMSFNTKNSANVLVNRLYIQSNGLIGVNTASPQSQFDVNGVCRATTFSGSGSLLSNIQYVTQPIQSNITGLGTLTNLTVSNLLTTQLISVGTGGSCQLQTIYGLSANLTNFVLTSNLTVSNTATISTLNVTNTCTASSFVGSGSLLTNLPVPTTAQYVTQPAQSNITSLGTITTLTVSGACSASSFAGDGSRLTNLPTTYGNMTIGVLTANDPANNAGAQHFIGSNALTNNTNIGLTVGKIQSLSNAGVIMYYHVADGSALNTMNFGMYGINNQIMTIAANSNVGIGTTTPAARLHLNGANPLLQLTSSTAQDNAILFDAPTTGGNKWYVGAGGTSAGGGNGFYIYNGTTTKATVLVANGGNVGIATTTPGSLLSFGQTVANKIITLWDGAPTDAVAGATNFFGFGINNNTLRYQVPAAGFHIFYQGTTPSLTIDGSGNSYFNGTINMLKNSGRGCEAYYAANDRYGITQDANGTMRMYTSSYYGAASIKFCSAISDTAFTDFMTILTSGFVGIGRSDPPYKFSLQGPNTSQYGPHIATYGRSDAYPIFNVLSWDHDNICMMFDAQYNGGFTASTTGTSYSIYKQNNKLNFNFGSNATAGGAIGWTTAMSIGSAGQVNIGTVCQPTNDNGAYLGGSFNRFIAVYAVNGVIQTSDSRTKTSVPLTYGLAEIMQVNTINFQWNSQALLPDTDPTKNFRYFGTCADQLVNIFPELCYSNKYDASGNAVVSTEDVQMNYAELTPVLINCVKELKRENDLLVSRVSTLEAKLASVLAILSKNNIS